MSHHSGVISHEEVLRSVYDFFSFHGYRDSLAALQAESGVAYNVIQTTSSSPSASPGRRSASPRASKEGLEVAVMDGNWSEVLQVYTDGLLLPEDVRAHLYETIFEELLEVLGLQPAAKALFYNAPAFVVMRQSAPARFARLERLLLDFDAVAWEEQKRTRAGALSTEVLKRRSSVLKSLLSFIHFTAEPYLGKLPTALYLMTRGRQATAGNEAPPPEPKRARTEPSEPLPHHHGVSAAHTTSGAPVPTATAAVAACLGYPLSAPRRVGRSYSCGEQEGTKGVSSCLILPEAEAETAVAVAAANGGGPSATVALVGRADGAVDFVDARTGAAIGQSASHTQGVLAMCLDESVAPAGAAAAACWVAVGYRDGWVKVYNTETRKLVRRFSQVHSMGVVCMTFAGHQHPEELAGHHRLLLTGSYDAAVKLLSLASGSTLATVRDAHHGAYINALCPLPSRGKEEHFTGAAMSAGNDGTLAFWRVHREAERLAAEAAETSSRGGAARSSLLLSRVGSNMNVRALHAECRDAVATMLVWLSSESPPSGTVADAASEAEPCVTGEVLVLTRSAVALILSVTLEPTRSDGGVGQPVRPVLLCLLRASKPLRHVSCMTSASSPVPMLSVYATTEEGTVLLYNVEMSWRDEPRWKAFGGALVVSSPTDESPAVIAEAGHPVHDLRVCPLPLRTHEGPAVLASAESLPCLYLLED